MSNEIQTYQPKPRNAMIIKNLCPGLMEMGKIKIGNKGKARQSQGGGTWQAPQKLDHFLITTMQRGDDNNFLLDESLHQLFGDAPKSIPVRLIYDDISLNFATRYICYYGKTVFCSGDGEDATRLQKDGTHKVVTCPCGRQDPKYTGDDGPNGPEGCGGKNGKGKCKINGILSVIIDGAQSVGGVWKFRTTSYNSVVGILSSLALIQRITGGRLAGIPMNMTVTPKTVQDPVQGSQQTIYVVGLQYAGTIDSLRDTGYQIALTEAKHGISMARIEEDARLLLTHTPTSGLGDDLPEDVIEEFYPEEARPGAPVLVEPEKIEHEKAIAEPVAVDTAPPLAPVTETVDKATGEVIEVQPEPVQPEPVQQDHLQAAAPAQPQPEKRRGRPAKQPDAPPSPPAEPPKEDEFPDPPGTTTAQPGSTEELPHPAEVAEPEVVPAPAAPAPAGDDEPCGDLF